VTAWPNVDGPQCEFTAAVQKACNGQQDCNIGTIDPNAGPGKNGLLCPDPAIGTRKRARVAYQCNWSASVTTTPPFTKPPAAIIYELAPVIMNGAAEDGETLAISCRGVQPVPITHSTIKIIGADYGATGQQHCPLPAARPTKNFTTFVKRNCEGRTTCEFIIDAEICPGDPSVGIPKRAEVDYQCIYRWYTFNTTATKPPAGFPLPLPTINRPANTDGQKMSLSCP
jgi:hypothetical protein